MSRIRILAIFLLAVAVGSMLFTAGFAITDLFKKPSEDTIPTNDTGLEGDEDLLYQNIEATDLLTEVHL